MDSVNDGYSIEGKKIYWKEDKSSYRLLLMVGETEILSLAMEMMYLSDRAAVHREIQKRLWIRVPPFPDLNRKEN